MKGDKFYLFDKNDEIFLNDEIQKNSIFSEDDIEHLCHIVSPDNPILQNKSELESDSPVSDWKILFVGNENDHISFTKPLLSDYKFQNRKLLFFEANTKEVAKKICIENDDIALIFLDVFVENNYDGLELVKYIREDLKNELVRIVLRTDKPEYVPGKQIISDYRINFYQTKSELTEIQLYTLTASLLDSFNSLKTIREYNKNLKQIIAEKTLDLRVKNEEYKNAIATKNKMFSIIAHDLVNPFNSLLGFSDILRTQCHELSPEKIKQFSDVIWQTSRSTFDLLSNLLEWSRIQTGKIKFVPQNTFIYRLVKANINLLQLQARQKNLSLTFSCSEDISVFCDLNMINTVLRNLISNGIKFTQTGGVDVQVSVVNDECKIYITDTGIGITSSKIKILFDPYYTSSKGTAGENGSGIGLMLCNDFIRLNNGKIEVDSKINKGSTFTLTLPLSKP